MTTPNLPTQSVARRAWFVCLASLLLMAAGLRAQTKVDTELLLMIDVSGSVTSKDYAQMMDAYGSAMTSSAVLDAIQGGGTGKIAAAVAFWSSANRQTVGVGWMEISDLGSARVFAGRIREVARPFLGTTAIAAAIDFAVPLFGTETGGRENGFHSHSQIIEIAGDGTDNSSPPRMLDRSVNVMAARDNALRSGVDMINGLGLNTTPERVSEYYQRYVIGGEVAGTPSFVRAVDNYDAFEEMLAANLVAGISAGSRASAMEAVPEPSAALLVMPGALLLLLRRRRTNTHP